MKNEKIPPVINCDGSLLSVNFDPDRLTDEVNNVDFPEPNITVDPDSAIIALRSMFADDKIERMLMEPGSEYDPLLQGIEDKEQIDRVYDLRGDISSLFDDVKEEDLDT